MTRTALLLGPLLCLLWGSRAAPGELRPAPELEPPAQGGTGLERSVRASASASWLNLIAEYADRSESDSAEDDDWFPKPIPITIPLGRKKSMPLLVLPIPVPASSSKGCAADVRESSSARPPWSRPLEGSSAELDEQLRSDVAEPRPHAPPALPHRATPSPGSRAPQEDQHVDVPRIHNIGSSQELVKLFHDQKPDNPNLPPLLLPEYDKEEATDEQSVSGSEEQRGRGRGAPAPDVAQPARPRFDRSMLMRGTLTVPRSDYTETFTVWWDASSGAARVDFFDGATSTYRVVLPDGHVQGVEMHVDRTEEFDVLRCVQTAPRRAAPPDRAPPALPDLDLFSFGGYTETPQGRAERWKLTAAGRGGELGGVRGEALTFRHELLLVRAPDNYTAVPLQYTVSVDSSVLGYNVEGYEFRYQELRYETPDPALLQPNTADVCEELSQTDKIEVVEPLREYTMPYRDPRYDAELIRLKTKFYRQYSDDVEEALRKTLLIGASRFISAANRQSGPSLLEVNFLADRLEAEQRLLLGAGEAPGPSSAEAAPTSQRRARRDAERLPRNFDWRRHGAVTPVRFQGSCSSCWAFAVVGAVEGALFLRTSRLVPLSEQDLIDCAHPYGGHGCSGTWPRAAYDYIQDQGLRALDEYLPYEAKVLQCAARQTRPVTHISGHVNVTRNSELALKAAIRRNGPNVVLVDGQSKGFIYHKKGVLYDNRCKKRSRNHAVLAVGWGERRGESFFVVKNSWSSNWANEGYGWLHAPSNTCGVLTEPSYPVLRDPDVDRLPRESSSTDPAPPLSSSPAPPVAPVPQRSKRTSRRRYRLSLP
ncbi:uncharacterized protein LOC101739363 [Bombyx mori]|uniref:Peptidase C1A papain C-terminal domain-containing protein n=1 Tax=Bombyx mori TaxID=7091 RepID=A0A8R1WHM5_BOMMO|nr:uncharacterized protein LOC101739363 isoform X1 [Bombyx mori]